MMKTKINNFFSSIKNYSNFLILTHIKPDGDALGSSLALYNYLSQNKKCDLIIDSVLPENFSFLYNYEAINKKKLNDYDILICLDCADKSRLGKYENYLTLINNSICIDHHETNKGFCKENIIFNKSSTCEIIYDIFKLKKIKMSKDILTCLFTGLSSDTGNFMHSNTTSEVFEIAKEIMEKGIDFENIINNVYKSNKLSYYKLLSIALDSLTLYNNNKIAIMNLTQKDFEKVGAKKESTEGICSYAHNIKDVKVGILITEKNKNHYKIALRSDVDFNVAKIAEIFGGGGHAQASGCEYNGDRKSCINLLIKEISKKL